jgi:hypothetical protein
MLEKHDTPLSKYLRELVDRAPLSDDEIGILCGFKNGNLIRAFAKGQIRPPLDRISVLAETLNGDLRLMFSLALRELFSPKLLQELKEVNVVHIERSEATWLQALNEIFDGDIPEMNEGIRDRLELIIKAV